MIRTFIAIDVPTEVKDHIARVQNELRNVSGAKASWSRLEGIHLTLKFLGDVEKERLSEINEAVQDAASGIRRFELTTAIPGGFPNLARPRVLWWGLKGSKPLMILHKQIDQNLAQIGFPAERKKFHAHLTVGRVKYIDRNSDLIERFEDCEWDPISWTVEHVNVMSSQLKPSGAVYRVMASIPLG